MEGGGGGAQGVEAGPTVQRATTVRLDESCACEHVDRNLGRLDMDGAGDPSSSSTSRRSSESSSTSGTTSLSLSSTSTSNRRRGRPEIGRVENEDKLHPVHKHFVVHEIEEKVFESHCIHSNCNKKVPGKHTYNLLSHLEHNHKKAYQDVVRERITQKGQNAVPKKRLKLSILNGVKMSGEALQLHSLRLVTEHGLSFKALDYDAFQDIVQPLIDAMPAAKRVTISSNTIPEKIPDYAEKVRKKIAEEVKGKMISVTVDGCSRNHRHFIGLNIQYEHEGKVVVRTLGVEELFVSSTAANLKMEITRIFKKFNILIKSIVSFTTDNGSNYVLAGKLLNEDDLDFDIDEDFDLPEGIELLQGEFSIQSIRCAAHTTELSIDEAVRPKVDGESMKPLLLSVRKLVNFLRNPSNVRQLQEEGLTLPTVECLTRWGSTFDSADSVYKLKGFLDRGFTWNSAKEKNDYNLTKVQWKDLENFLDDLRPARKAIVQLQRSDLTLGEFYKIWTQLTMTLKKKSSALADRLINAMSERSKSVKYKDRVRRGEERLSPLFNYPAFNAALLMDPRYFSLLTPEQIVDGKSYLVELWQRMQFVKGLVETEENEDSDPDELASETIMSDSDSDEDGGFAKLLMQKNKERQQMQGPARQPTRRATIRALLDEYDRVTDPLPASADIMKYWKSRQAVSPELYELAMVVLAIPATQVTVERLFSALKFILRPQRFNLSSAHIDNIVLLHSNKELLREIVKELLLFEERQELQPPVT